ncbi:MAG: hypothetical protein P4L71_20100 [Acetobacteraceae bacterium]|nr:hypothetical protein [Acetobacteraceae bacterium]
MKFALCLIALLFPSASWADDFLGEASSSMAAIGVTADYQTIKGKGDTVVITIDYEKYLQSIPMLQSMGAINPDITQTTINKTPYHMVLFATVFFGSAIVPEAYRTHPSADRIHFSEVLNSLDDYGNNESHELESFDFSRQIFQKVNWSHFRGDTLPKIAPNFRPTRFFADKIESED